jgi:UDPglucose 6-dehydrogenase
MIERNLAAGPSRSSPLTPRRGVEHGLFILIAVGTPPDEDGSADLKYVLAVARTIGQHLNKYAIVITKSTVPVGTSDKVRRKCRRRWPRVPPRWSSTWCRTPNS